ncbi:MAG: tetratricopeptide repeat protein, partial [Cyanobacteria bacterium P01_C01_bin.38]
MVTKSSTNPDEQNQDAYDDLIVSIEAGEGKLSLLIAVCDNGTFREEIINKYETELQPHFRHYRTTLARGEPSLNAAINQLVEQEEYLRNSQPAVITVTGVQQLFFLKLGEEQSEQEKFFGYLQWTREALREYPFAIVLWVTNQILVNLIKQAPDFWSWRSGVFHFVSKAKNFVEVRELEPIRLTFQGTELDDFDDDKSYSLSVEDLQRLIEEIERESGKEDKKLASLYVELAGIYKRRLDRGEAGDYQKEQSLAVKYYSKAIKLQTKLG